MIRLDFEHVKEILPLIEPDTSLQEIVGGNKLISTAERLSLTIQFLVTGESLGSLSLRLCISNQQMISYIIKSVCNAIVKYLVLLYLRVPSAEEEWLSTAEKFESRWQYPNAIGAVDGKHVVIQK